MATATPVTTFLQVSCVLISLAVLRFLHRGYRVRRRIQSLRSRGIVSISMNIIDKNRNTDTKDGDPSQRCLIRYSLATFLSSSRCSRSTHLTSTSAS